MKSYRISSIILLVALFINSALPAVPANAQTQLLFEGMIAYVDATGNVIITTGDGNHKQITTDANLDYASNARVAYEEISFSPSGSYLAFLRNEDGASFQMVIYDIKNNSIATQIPYENNLSWYKWDKDTDSFIVEDSKTDEDDNSERELYLQTVSGEKTLLAKFATHANVYNIGYDADTVIYIDPPYSNNINIYNWAKNTVMLLNLHQGGVPGEWMPDGKSFILEGDSGNYYAIDLETGKYKEITKSQELEWAPIRDVSPNSTSILLGNHLHLYDLNLETREAKILYNTLYPSDDFYNDVYGIWSPSNRLIVAYENDPTVDINNNFTDLYVTDGSNPLLISNNAEPYLWLSNSAERFLYAKNNISGQQISRELMLYDYNSQSSVKIGDLPGISDIEKTWEVPTEQIVDWTDGGVDLPSAPGTIPPTVQPLINQIEGQIGYVGGDGNVYLMRSGQSPIQVTHNLGEPMRNVAFSQSGQWLSFINREDNLYVIDTKSQSFDFSHIGVKVSDYDWANLSEKIAYVSDSKVSILDFSTSVKDESGATAVGVSWSPDDKNLAVARSRGCPENPDTASGSNSQIVLHDIGNKNERIIYETSALETIDHTEWSAGGGYLFHVINPCLAVGVFGDAQAIDLNGNEIKDGFDLKLWSKEDKFFSAREINQVSTDVYDSEIYKMQPGSNSFERIYYSADKTSIPEALSPDGKTLLFASGQSIAGYSGLAYDVPGYWLIQADGNNARQIADQDFNFILWSPSGEQLLYANSTSSNIYSISSGTMSQIADVVIKREPYNYSYDVAWGKLDNTILLPPVAKCEGAADVQPIILVEGWGGNVDSLYLDLENETKEFPAYTRDFFSEYGYVADCNIFYAVGMSATKTQKENAQILRDNICDSFLTIKSYRPDWNGHFDMIGFSYGGPRSRAYLEDSNLYGTCDFDRNEAYDKVLAVDNLFTLGSPHGGEPYDAEMLPLATIIIGGDFWAGITTPAPWFSPAAKEMLPPVRAWVNLISRQPAEVNYHLIVGNAEKDLWAKLSQILSVDISLPSWKILSHLLPSKYYDNDLAVHQSSSLILDSVLLKSHYPNLRTAITHDWHGWDPSARPVVSPPTYYSESETLKNEVLPYIGKTDMPSGGGGGRPWMVLPVDLQNKIMANVPPISVTQQELHEYAPQVNIHLGDGILASGQSQQFELNVFQSEGMGLTLLTGNKDIQVQLIQPDGQIVTKDTAGIQYQELMLEGRTLKGYQFASIPSGKWVVVVDGTTISEESSFIAFATPSMQIALQPILPEWRPNQSSVEILMKVVDGNSQVSGSSLSALVIRPDGSQQTLDLFDDGTHQDGGVNDGFYGNVFSQTDIGGVYRVFFNASGAYNNQSFVRNAISYFVIAPVTASLSDQFSDSGVDENNDNTYEFLEVQAPLVVQQPGNYVISADLYAGDTFVAPVASHQGLQPGNQTAIWRFEGKLIYESQKDGPYTVRNILLLDETELPLLIEEKQAYTTAKYSYTDFGPKNITFPTSFSPTTLFLAGGLGLLCLGALMIGGVFVFTRSRKPKLASSQTTKSQPLQTLVSSSAEKIKHAIQLAKSNRLQEAFDILREVVKSEPNNASAWFNLGSVFVHMENYRDAERCYSRAKQLGHPKADDELNSLRQKRQ
ncbi:MAG: PD40 domain-containing protein [Chloroflexi bacterium]|nr:PD40 domain-containing protein [Chloroflexota bacterium]